VLHLPRTHQVIFHRIEASSGRIKLGARIQRHKQVTIDVTQLAVFKIHGRNGSFYLNALCYSRLCGVNEILGCETYTGARQELQALRIRGLLCLEEHGPPLKKGGRPNVVTKLKFWWSVG